jgi:sulfatase maturation enzyme AslB (radical SAM superfamily)
MLKGEWHPACARCRTEEQNGVKSSRLGWNEDFSQFIDDAIAYTDSEGHAPVKIRYMDLRLGNACNLKCRMCNPYASRRWLEDWDQVFNPLDATETERLQALDWIENPRAWELLTGAMKDCLEIYFTGGEPLSIEAHWRLLRFIIRKGLAGNIILKYNTNTTYANAALFELWSHFKTVRLNCSVDGVGEINSYIRHPSRWPWVLSKLQMLNEYAKSAPQLQLKIHTTVQNYNFIYMTDVFKLLETLPAFKNLPFLNILDRPGFFNIRTLPVDLKLLGLERLERWRRTHAHVLENADPVYVERLRSLESYVMSQPESADGFDRFREVTRSLDAVRGQNFCQVAPEFLPYFQVGVAKDSPTETSAAFVE